MENKLLVIYSSIYLVSRTSDRFHVASLHFDGCKSSQYCSCIGFSVRNYCKHLKQLRKHPDIYKSLEKVKDMSVHLIPSTVVYIQDLFGGLPTSVVFGQYASHKIGKTVSGIQMAFDSMVYHKYAKKQIVNALILDTEDGGLAQHVLPHWVEKFEKSRGLNVGIELWQIDYQSWDNEKTKLIGKFVKKEVIKESKENKIIVIDVDSLDKMHLLHGRPVNIEYSSGGKPTVKATPAWNKFKNIEDTPLQKIITEEKIQFLMYDSFTQLLTSSFVGGTQSFPARNDSQSILAVQAQQLARHNNLFCLMNYHESKTVDGEFNTWVGGKAIGHNTKFFIRLDENKLAPEDSSASARIAELIRHPVKTEGKVSFIINDKGIQKWV